MSNYIHGYSPSEAIRLNDQADSLAALIHYDSFWTPGSRVLEVGCGVGAQTKTIAFQNPEVSFTSIDLSPESIAQARLTIEALGLNNVQFLEADLHQLPFSENTFDHVFFCFVLEHLPQPQDAIQQVLKVLKPGGTMTAIEGDHGSTYFFPDSPLALKAVACQVQLQAAKGGNANIGRALFPLLQNAGLTKVQVSPRMVYVDDSKPNLVEGFTKNTFTAMIQGIAPEAIEKELISKEDMDRGIQDLLRTAAGGGTFCYTFFKGKGIKPTA